MRSKRTLGGFTLVELMVVVAIIGVLSAIAVPAFIRNARKAKTSEAVVNIRKIYGASRSYIIEDHFTQGSGTVLPPQFPLAEAATPVGSCCTDPNGSGKCSPSPSSWNRPTWTVLQFSLEDPHYYQYEYDSTGPVSSGQTSRFTVRAKGDLDCDTTSSTFEMIGEWSSVDHDVHGSAGLFELNALE